MKQEWKVGELAKLARLTVRTLRYYDQIGLFSPSGHTDSGHRIYTESDIAQLQQVLSLKELGLSLDQVKSVIDGNHFSLFDIVSLQIEHLKESISLQQKLLQELEHVTSLMKRKEPLTVQEFTKILSAMRTSHLKFFAERVFSSWSDPSAKARWFPKADEFEFRVGGREESRMSVSVTTVEIKQPGNGTQLIYTEQGAFFDGRDTPEQREHGTKFMLDKLGLELQNE
ncbi:MerR family transcriptional regulator [Paenibacillus tyrfis]|uniref:MerR family transcriptional regulator n=1 Tax=Paenibacillus tyrfis TaxID=1501230 RepID=UPI0020A0BF23|nr:MerR family transcriptional regulator [Paenibacillus tyrfis]MCP1308557.1 MerR family transcriptional regulator [Paenibacillus tyrfis]